ncbi:heme peroxidase [Methylopila sp. Yamaguchi]|nr:heme peroxidase [Methylopila sp. Yamaguchi]
MSTSFTVNQDDLAFILAQIKIAERHSAGESLQDIIGPDSTLLPYGLRTVDGTLNNLLPGHETIGAADTVLPRMLNPTFLNEGDDSMAVGPGIVLTNNDYGSTGSVVDADPRIISNLIADMSPDNPAAVAAWYANPLAQALYEEANGGPPPEGYVPTIDELALIPNQSPDIGLSPPFNAWMTFFGQFFDHGLDLITKGGNGTVYIPLQPDDPLYDPAHPELNFMALTRSTQVNGHETVNTTTSWIDQNQTYTSHPSHQAFLREYAFSVDSDGDGTPDSHPVSTGTLLEGAHGGIANWAEIKAQALMLGIRLTDNDVHDVPLLRTDPYGKLILGPNGFAQIATPTGFVEGVEGGLPLPANTVRTGHAFLNDIAHHAIPGATDHDHNPGTPPVQLVADGDRLDVNGDGSINAADLTAGAGRIQDANGDSVIDLADLADVNLDGVIDGKDLVADDNNPLTYDDEMLDAHYVTGDGRGNENIALTAVHTVFHAEHNRLVEANKATILETGDLAFINEWLVNDITEIPADTSALVWDGERLFQAARFVTEMEYQHLVFEEFARKVQPAVNPFVFTNTADIDPSITAEFAHVVYRFGHSMLTETVGRMDADMTSDDIALFDAFLNPQQFEGSGVTAAEAAGAIIRGSTRQIGNEIDEFVTDALRNNLVGLPLDLAALNIARARETGVPSLNEARAQFYEDTGFAQIKPYESWLDFTGNIKNPLSIVNFIAAYGTHESITSQTTLAGKRAAATALVLGTTEVVNGVTYAPPADRDDFLNSTGDWAGVETGLNKVDFWIGGLAEQKMEFGGMLGSTFTYVFEAQLTNLQNGDRLYYLSRTQGLNLLNELEANTFSQLVMRNTDLGDPGSSHLPGDLFGRSDLILELNQAVQIGADPVFDNPTTQTLTPKVTRRAPGADVDGDGHADGGYLQFRGGEHVVLGGTEGNDTLLGDKGIDALWGGAGNDYLNAGMESDQVFGGDGDDIIIDPFGDDFLRGGDGNDVISGGAGLDILHGGRGQDAIFAGANTTEVFAGEGDDFILGGAGSDNLMGNEGDDWIEGGDGFDGLTGENSQLFFNSTIVGHDILNGQGNDTDYDGENGDDIMFEGAGIQRNNGMAGFDWAIHKSDPVAANSDLGIPIFVTQQALILRDRFDSVEGLSGWKFDDILTGTNRPVGGGGTIGGNGAENVLTQAGVDRIANLQQYFGPRLLDPNGVVFDPSTGGDIILGGDGNDLITGKGGDDIIDGDRWLNVRISVRDPQDHDVELFTVNSLSSLRARLLSREINPSQLVAVREILDVNATDDVDTAAFTGNASNYVINGLAPDGSITVTDTTGIDGVDRLWGIERLQFADVTIDINGSGNAVPFGSVTISNLSPEQSQELTAFVDVDDVNGIQPGTMTVTWQVFVTQNGIDSWVDIAGATGETFTPTQAEVGLQIRAIASFVDGLGLTERVFSEATDAVINVNDAPTDITAATALEVTENGVNGVIVGSVLAADPDGPAGLVYSIIDDPEGRFAIDAAGQITVADRTLIDFDQNASHTVTVRVSDGEFTFEKAFTVTVHDVAPEQVSGDARNNVIHAGAGADKLDGLGGADTLKAGVGDDIYYVDNLGDLVLEDAGEGDDLVYASKSWTLGSGSSVETIRTNYGAAAVGIAIGGNELANALYGGAKADTLSGGDGADRLDGGLGADEARGGAGNDTYIVGAAGDRAVEAAGGGSDTVYSTVDWTLEAGSAVETIRARYSAGAPGLTLTGNELANKIFGGGAADILVGGGGNDVLTGGLGADQLRGGIGNDTFYVDATGDVVTELAGEGTDTVYASSSWTLGAGSAVETLRSDYGSAATGITLTGNELNNKILGGAQADTLNGGDGDDALTGGGGADQLNGGLGNDAFYVDSSGDVVLEAVGEGQDTVYAATSWTMTAGSSIESLRANYGAGAGVSLTGNELANTLVGGAGNDVLNGGGGNDILSGAGGGDDLFRLTANFGNDRINQFDAVAAGGQDHIDLSSLGVTAQNFAANVSFSQVSSSTLVTVAGGTVLLVGVNIANVDITDFALA